MSSVAPQPVPALDLPPIVVLTGTGTGVGKTVAIAALAAHALAQGRSVCVVKPVQTGVASDDPPDVDEVRRLLGPDAGTVRFEEFVRLPEPLAPQQAARRAGRPLPPLKEHAGRIVALAQAYDVVLVEGAGGLLVRLDGGNDGDDGHEPDGGTLADLARLLPGAQAVIAAEPGLGTLSVTELTTEALARRGVPVFGLIIGRWPADPGVAERGNLAGLPALSGTRLLGVVHEGLTVPPVLAVPPVLS